MTEEQFQMAEEAAALNLCGYLYANTYTFFYTGGGTCFNIKTVSPGVKSSTLKMGWISYNQNPELTRQHLYIDTSPGLNGVHSTEDK